VSEKRHPPSARRLRDARKQGQVARSRLFTGAAVTLGALAATLATASHSAQTLRVYTLRLLGAQPLAPSVALAEGLSLLLRCLAPSLTGALLASLAASVTTAGLHFEPAQVAPKLERLDLAQGFKKLFSASKLIELGKGLLVAALVGWVVVGAARSLLGEALKATGLDGASAFGALLAAWRPVVLEAAALLALLGVGDLALARRKHRADLMMSHEELKQEHRSAEGDPHARGQRKALQRRLNSGGPARGLQKATAVVVNPTHIAVALRYVEGECDAPYIVAKGREEDALKLRSSAQSLGIPVVKDLPLARSLVQFDVGDEVPEELYQAAAAVLKVALEASAGRDPVQALTASREG
jgi:type III secretion protein U